MCNDLRTRTALGYVTFITLPVGLWGVQKGHAEITFLEQNPIIAVFPLYLQLIDKITTERSKT